jgi:hypothetical protein
VNATVPVKPETGVTVAVYVALCPAITAWEAGVADSVKFDTVTVRVAGWLASPLSSVTVNDAE